MFWRSNPSELLRVACAERTLLTSRTFTENSGVCDNGQESFDAETREQNRHLDGCGCRTGDFAGRERISIHDPRCQRPAI
jgi:hypothetical protein